MGRTSRVLLQVWITVMWMHYNERGQRALKRGS